MGVLFLGERKAIRNDYFNWTELWLNSNPIQVRDSIIDLVKILLAHEWNVSLKASNTQKTEKVQTQEGNKAYDPQRDAESCKHWTHTRTVVNVLALITVNERWGCSGSVRESYYEKREDVEVKKLFGWIINAKHCAHRHSILQTFSLPHTHTHAHTHKHSCSPQLLVQTGNSVLVALSGFWGGMC